MIDDFEQRLAQGLKRWAEAGEPTMDLSAHLGGRRPGRGWLRWSVSLACVALIAAALGFTFPRWAGAAQDWPIIGPVVNEYIIRDAGLKAVYDTGMLKGVLAEVSDGPVTVRILGVAADRASTLLIYQVTGLTTPPGLDLWWNRPKGGLWDRLQGERYTHPVSIRAKVTPGAAGAGSGSGVDHRMTPFGLFGTLMAPPVGPQGGTAEVQADVEGRKLTLQFPVSRTEADKLTREIPLAQTREIDGIAYRVATVIQTPSATAVRWQVEKSEFRGLTFEPNHDYAMWLENQRTVELPIYTYRDDSGYLTHIFPRVDLPARVRVKADVKGLEVQLTWPLALGAIAEVDGQMVTLTDWSERNGQLAVEWSYDRKPPILSFGDFEVIDQAGQAHLLAPIAMGGGGSLSTTVRAAYLFSLPQGIHPMAIRATRLAAVVQGPWIFEVPAK